MNLYSLPNFVVSIYALTLGTITFVKGSRNRINHIFFLMSLSIFVWLFSYGVLFSINDYGIAMVYGKIGHAAAILLTPIVYYFFIEILGPYRKKIDIFIARLSVFLAIFFVLLMVYHPLYFPSLARQFWGYYPRGGPLMVVYASWTYFIAFRATSILWLASKDAKRESKFEDYQRFKYYSLSLCIFMPASIDYLGKFSLNIYPFGYLFVGAFCSLITYAIARHRLFSVDIIIRRSFVYSLLVAAITFLYLVIILISEHIFRSYFGYQNIFTAVTTSLIVAVTFNPLRSRIQMFIDKYFLGSDPEKLARENAQLKQIAQQHDHMKAVATLASGMAHEIKNPLTSIKTFAEYLPNKYQDAEFREKFQRIIIDEVNRVNGIVQQLLDFSKPRDPEFKSVTVTEILNDILDLMSADFIKLHIVVERFIPEDLIIRADKNQLRQAFLNLLLNSMQAMPSGGKLTIGAERSPDGLQILIYVSDTGCGISLENLPHIFDPFHSNKEGGTGLGLAITQSIIEKNKGKITVSSRVDTGTEFTLSFPCAVRD